MVVQKVALLTWSVRECNCYKNNAKISFVGCTCICEKCMYDILIILLLIYVERYSNGFWNSFVFLFRSSTAVCLANGLWSGELPFCGKYIEFFLFIVRVDLVNDYTL